MVKNSRKSIIYTRFSPRRYADQCESCEAQEETCRAYGKAKGWPVFRVLSDKGVSGKTANRPKFQEAVALACHLKAVLLVHDLSRYARSVVDALTTNDRLEEAGAALSSVRDNIDTTTPGGRLFFTIIVAVAQMEREVIASRTSDAMQRHQRNGRKMGGCPPFGMQIDPYDNARLVENVEENRCLAVIKQCREDELPYVDIAKLLTASGFVPRGKAWKGEAVKKIYYRHIKTQRQG